MNIEHHDQQQEGNHHVIFRNSIQEGRWDSVREYLQSPIRSSLCQHRYEANLTCLGIAICFWAPLDIIDEMIKIDASLTATRDGFGLTPLHLGCLNGAPLHIIQYILHEHKYLVRALDRDGRSPLHHAVECACCNALRLRSPSYIDVVKVLLFYDPEMVQHQDVMDLTPIDMVQELKADAPTNSVQFEKLEHLYQVLKLVSIHVYRMKQKLWEDKYHKSSTTNSSMNKLSYCNCNYLEEERFQVPYYEGDNQPTSVQLSSSTCSQQHHML